MWIVDMSLTQHRHECAAGHVVLALCVCRRRVYTLPRGSWNQTTVCQPAVILQ